MKLANGSGSIIKLNGNRRKPYGVRVTVGWDNGKQVRKYLGYYATQNEAILALAEYHKNGYDIDMSKTTLQEAFDMFMKRAEKKGLSESVLKNHRMVAKKFGILAKKPLVEIKAMQLQDWLDDLHIKPSTKGKFRSTLSQVYDLAIKSEIATRNLAKGLEITEKVEKVGKVFTDEQIATLWKHSDEVYVQDILILIYTGMRIGELIEMHKDNVNLEDRYMIGGSKTEAGKNRTIPIHTRLLPMIEKRLQNSNYILNAKKGSKIVYRTADIRFKKIMERFGWEGHTLHDARKTGISIMHSNGIPMEVIRMIVGHSGKGVTEKIYLFKSPKELVEQIDKVIIPF